MRPLHRWSPISERSTRAIVISAGVSVLYTAVVLGYSVHPATDVSISGTLWHALVLYSVVAFGSIGIPLILWMRYEIRSSSVLLACILLFWHVLVEFPPIGSGEGDSPGFLFVFAWMPFYIVAYGLLAGGEYWLRGRANSVSTPET